MRLVFGGHHTTVTGDPYNEGYVYYASSDAAGAGWTLAPNTAPAVAHLVGLRQFRHRRHHARRRHPRHGIPLQ